MVPCGVNRTPELALQIRKFATNDNKALNIEQVEKIEFYSVQLGRPTTHPELTCI